MRYFDLVAYTATQIDALNYSITPVAGAKELPENVERCSMSLLDASGNSCQSWGVRVGTNFRIQTVRGSSAGLSPPSFPNGASLFSARHAVDMELANGLNGVWINGDSLAVGYTEGGRESDTGPNDWIDPTVFMRGHTPAVSGDDSPMYTALREPMRHSLRNEAVSDLGVAIPLAHGLRQKGFHNLCMLGNGQSSVGFTAYGSSTGSVANDAPSAGNMTRALTQAADFMEDGPSNSMLMGVFFVGTNDINYNNYQDYLDRLIWMANNYRSRLTALYNRDFSRLPLIFVGQCGEMLADPVTAGQNAGGLFNYEGAPTREQALAALPDYVPHTAYVDTAGLASHGDMFHYNAASYRVLGNTLIPEAFYRAMDNHEPVNMVRRNDWILGDAVSDMTVITPNTAVMGNVLQNAVSNMTVDVESTSTEATLANVLANAVSNMTVDVTAPSATPTLDANAFDIVLRPDQGITSDASGNVSNWQSVGTNNMDFPQTVAARQPKLVTGANGGIDCRTNRRLHKDSGFNLLRNTTAGSTIIVSFTPSSTNGHLLGTTYNRIGMGSLSWANTMDWQNVSYGHNGSWLIPDARQTLVITIDSTDGIRIDHNGTTLHSNAASNPATTTATHFTIGGWETQNYFDGIIHAVAIKDGSGYMAKATTDAIATEMNAL